jgi:hypothetical protein
MFAANCSFDVRNDNMKTKVTNPLDHYTTTTDGDVDSASTGSHSLLSDDSIESPQPRLTHFTHDEEVIFFEHIYSILDVSFSEWEERVNYRSGQPLTLEKVEDATLRLPHIRETPSPLVVVLIAKDSGLLLIPVYCRYWLSSFADTMGTICCS